MPSENFKQRLKNIRNSFDRFIVSLLKGITFYLIPVCLALFIVGLFTQSYYFTAAGIVGVGVLTYSNTQMR